MKEENNSNCVHVVGSAKPIAWESSYAKPFGMIEFPEDFETKSIDKVAQFKSIANSLASLYERKNSDYGDSFGETFKKLGIISSITRMSDKLNRIISLTTKKNQKVNDESIADTLMDLASYSIMTLIELGYGKEKGTDKGEYEGNGEWEKAPSQAATKV